MSIASEADLPSFRSPTGELTVPCGAQVGHGSFVVYGTPMCHGPLEGFGLRDCRETRQPHTLFARGKLDIFRFSCIWQFCPVSLPEEYRRIGIFSALSHLAFRHYFYDYFYVPLYPAVACWVSRSPAEDEKSGFTGRWLQEMFRVMYNVGFGSGYSPFVSTHFSTWQVDLGSWCAVRTWFLTIFSYHWNLAVPCSVYLPPEEYTKM